MKKQILAITMILVLVVLAFTACGKKYITYTDDTGATHVLITNKEGNTILNDAGQLVAGVVDDKGNLVTVDGGEFETRGVDFPDQVVKGSTYETPDFIMKLPENLWGIDVNTLVLKNSEITIDISRFDFEEDQNITNVFSAEFEKINSLSKTEQYSNVFTNVGSSSMIFTNSGNREAYYFYADLNDESGAPYQHREAFYFACGDHYYKFLCMAPTDQADRVVFTNIMDMIKFK